jgi:hypothetical protein
MRQTDIIDNRSFRVTSYGNGFAYDFYNKRTDESVFFQGDDAATFEAEMDSRRSLSNLWSDYSEVAQPRDEVSRRG